MIRERLATRVSKETLVHKAQKARKVIKEQQVQKDQPAPKALRVCLDQAVLTVTLECKAHKERLDRLDRRGPKEMMVHKAHKVMPAALVLLGKTVLPAFRAHKAHLAPLGHKVNRVFREKRE